jgi:hypothetical protein
VTAKEQLRRRVDGLTEAQAFKALRVLEGQAEGAGDRLDALLDSAPPEDEPVSAEEEAATAEALADLERGDTVSHADLRRELLGR